MVPLLLIALCGFPATVKYNYEPIKVDTIQTQVPVKDPVFDTLPEEVPDLVPVPVAQEVKHKPIKTKIINKVLLPSKSDSIVIYNSIIISPFVFDGVVEPLKDSIKQQVALEGSPLVEVKEAEKPNEVSKAPLIMAFSGLSILIVTTYLILHKLTGPKDPYDNYYG